MFFKKLSIYKLTKPLVVDLAKLDELLEEAQFQECHPTQAEANGWERPLGKHGSMFIHSIKDFTMICFKRQEKIMPGAAITERLNKKADDIEERESRKLTRKERTQLKEDIIFEILPKALTKSSLLYAYIDHNNGYIFIDSSSSKKCEQLLSCLRETIGSVPVVPLATASIPSFLMSTWLITQEAPGRFEFSDNCILKEPSDSSDSAKFKGHNILTDEINSLLSAGMMVIECGFSYFERIDFVIDEQLVIKKLSFSDLISEQAQDAEDAVEQFDIDFSIMTLEIESLVAYLVKSFGGLADFGKEADEQTEITGLSEKCTIGN